MKKIIFVYMLFVLIFNIVFSDIMPLEEIKSGMKGECYSVIQGDKIETFEAEVIKIVKGQNSIKDMVLIKLSGENLKKIGGISEGMSGAPLYINNKFVGALSYTLEGALNNLALVTPANDMLKLSKYDEANTSNINTAIDNINKPGAAVIITPVKGDVTLDVVATISHIDGNKVYIAGHPITGKGAIRYFINRAIIDFSVPSSTIPFKLARNLETIGVVTQDRDAGLFGYLTKDIKTCRINLEVKTKIETKKINYDIVADDETISEFFHQALLAGLNKASDTKGNKISKYYFEIIDEQNNIIYKNSDLLYMSEDLLENTSETISNEIVNFIENPYKKVRLKRINIKIELSENKDIAQIKDFNLNKNIFKLGETIDLTINYNLYRRGLFKEKVKINIPLTFKVGIYNIKIYAGSEEKKSEPEFNDYESYYQFYKNQYKNNEIIVKIFRKDDTNLLNNFIEYRTALNSFVTLAKDLSGEIIIDSFEAN